MIVYEGPGDMFNCRSQTLTCPTNVVGAMGKGLAAEFRDRVEMLEQFYLSRFPKCLSIPNDRTLIHQLYVFPMDDSRFANAQVLLFPTKEHWRFPSRLKWIERNLQLLVEQRQQLKITSLAVPALGCGNGGLDYESQVRPLIYQYLDSIPTPVEILLR